MATMLTLVFLGACDYVAASQAVSDEVPAAESLRNVLEGHKDTLYINVPVSRAVLEPLLPDSLTVDTFDDDNIGWVSIVLDHVVTLDKYIGSPFRVFSPTHCHGWMTKVNILVRERTTEASKKMRVPRKKTMPTDQTMPESAGYLVTSLDFEASLAGWMLSTAAQCVDNILCTLAHYDIRTNTTLAVSSSVRNAHDGFYLDVQASNLTDFSTQRSRLFSKWVVERSIKYLLQPDGVAVCAPQWSDAIPRITADKAQVISGTRVQTNVFDVRLKGVGVGVEMERICAEETCFVQPLYLLMDHEKQQLGCRTPKTKTGEHSFQHSSAPVEFLNVLA